MHTRASSHARAHTRSIEHLSREFHSLCTHSQGVPHTTHLEPASIYRLGCRGGPCVCVRVSVCLREGGVGHQASPRTRRTRGADESTALATGSIHTPRVCMSMCVCACVCMPACVHTRPPASWRVLGLERAAPSVAVILSPAVERNAWHRCACSDSSSARGVTTAPALLLEDEASRPGRSVMQARPDQACENPGWEVIWSAMSCQKCPESDQGEKKRFRRSAPFSRRPDRAIRGAYEQV